MLIDRVLNRRAVGEVLRVLREAAHRDVKAALGSGWNNPVTEAAQGAAAFRSPLIVTSSAASGPVDKRMAETVPTSSRFLCGTL